MKQPTHRVLLWLGVLLLVLPTIFVVVVALFQPREFQTSVFLELDANGAVKRPPLIDRDGILWLIGIYLPGIFLVMTALLGRRSQRKAEGVITGLGGGQR